MVRFAKACNCCNNSECEVVIDCEDEEILGVATVKLPSIRVSQLSKYCTFGSVPVRISRARDQC